MSNSKEILNVADNLMGMLDASPTKFQAIAYAVKKLEKQGFVELDVSKPFPQFRAGDQYYVTKNKSTLFAFRVGRKKPVDSGFRLITAHSDSPTFSIKPNAEIYSDDGVVRLNVESYGTPIAQTWFDRPLSIAGRVVVKGDSIFHPRSLLLHIKRPLLTIPHLAYHLTKATNETALSIQKEMLPVMGILDKSENNEHALRSLIAEELNIEEEDILDFDLSLYDTTSACLLGLNEEFITSGRLDNLLMVHAGLSALLDSSTNDATQVLAVFDNEEVGSTTKQGAASPVLRQILERIVISDDAMGVSDFYCSIEKSFVFNADCSHGFHPNYSDKADITNRPVLGGGPVIQVNANQKYMTDAETSAVFSAICRINKIPFQYYANHSDLSGGNTLGSIFSVQLPIRGVDVGSSVWGMHSVRETASIVDQFYIIKTFTSFFDL